MYNKNNFKLQKAINIKDKNIGYNNKEIYPEESRLVSGKELFEMKFKWDKKYLYWGVTAFLVVVSSIVFFLIINRFDVVMSFFGTVLTVLTPIIYGFVIAYLLSPVATFFEKPCFRRLFYTIQDKKEEAFLKKNPGLEPPPRTFPVRKVARVLSVVITMILAFGFIVGLFWLVLPQLVETISGLVKNMPTYIDNLSAWLSNLLKDYPEIEKYVLEITSSLSENITTWLSTDFLPQLNNIWENVSSSLLGIFSTATNLLLGFIIAIYFLNSKELFAAQCKKILYSFLNLKSATKIINTSRHLHKTFGNFISGKLLDSLIIGFLFFIFLTVFNLPYAMLVSIIMGVSNIIPFFGPFIGAVPSLLLIMLVDPIQCLYFLIMVVIIQQFDGNILAPRIIGESTGLPSFWVVFALLVGQSIFGFWGLIIGIPLFAVIYSLVKAKISDQLANKNLPTDSNDYREIKHIDAESSQPQYFVHEPYVKTQSKWEIMKKKREEKKAKKDKNHTPSDSDTGSKDNTDSTVKDNKKPKTSVKITKK